MRKLTVNGQEAINGRGRWNWQPSSMILEMLLPLLAL